MNQCAITIDVDWAPDFAIDLVASILSDRDVRATWFVTHASDAIERLRANDLFELGIHPNFLPGSTHGADEPAVLAHCLALVPDAVSMRMHGLYQSTPLLTRVMNDTPIELDSSLFLPGVPSLAPFMWQYDGARLLRVPYYWEDDVAMGTGEWQLETLLEGPGLKVFDFHPIHVALNSASLVPYRALVATVGDLAGATEADTVPHVHSGIGTQTFFTALVDRLAADGMQLRALL